MKYSEDFERVDYVPLPQSGETLFAYYQRAFEAGFGNCQEAWSYYAYSPHNLPPDCYWDGVPRFPGDKTGQLQARGKERAA